MELSNIFLNRNKSFVKLSEAADYLSNIIRENVVIFEIETNEKKATFLTESKSLISCEYSLDEGKTVLTDFSVQGIDSILSDDRVDTLVSEEVSRMVNSLNEGRYDTAEYSFSEMMDAFRYRNQINETRESLYNKLSRFGDKTVICPTVEYSKLCEHKDNIIKFLKENAEEISQVEDIVNGMRLSNALDNAFSAPAVDIDDLPGKTFGVPQNNKESLYEMICRQELISKEIMESKKNFSKLWAGHDGISQLASCIYSSDDTIKENIMNVIQEVPYFALAAKADINQVLSSVYEVSNPGTVSKKDIRLFVSKIFEMKKPAKQAVIAILSENYGININNLKFVPSFNNLAKVHSVVFEALSQKCTESQVLKEGLREFSKFIRDKSGVEVLSVNDFVLECFSSAGLDVIEEDFMAKKLDMDTLGEEIVNEVKTNPQYGTDDETEIISSEEESPDAKDNDKDNDKDKKKKKKKKKDGDEDNGDEDKVKKEGVESEEGDEHLEEQSPIANPAEAPSNEEAVDDTPESSDAELTDKEIKSLVGELANALKELDFDAIAKTEGEAQDAEDDAEMDTASEEDTEEDASL